MKHGNVNRRAVSAIVAVSFVAVALSGLFLFLRIKNGVIFTIHEWTGLLFVAAGVMHLTLNWKALTCYCRQGHVRLALVGTLIFVILLGIIGAGRRPPRGRGNARRGPAAEILTPAAPQGLAQGAGRRNTWGQKQQPLSSLH